MLLSLYSLAKGLLVDDFYWSRVFGINILDVELASWSEVWSNGIATKSPQRSACVLRFTHWVIINSFPLRFKIPIGN